MEAKYWRFLIMETQLTATKIKTLPIFKISNIFTEIHCLACGAANWQTILISSIRLKSYSFYNVILTYESDIISINRRWKRLHWFYSANYLLVLVGYLLLHCKLRSIQLPLFSQKVRPKKFFFQIALWNKNCGYGKKIKV